MIEVIAEIGKNFVTMEREEPWKFLLERAKTLVIEAKKAGADIVKFQTHNFSDEIYPESDITSPHFDVKRYEWIKRNTYPVEFWWELIIFCRGLGIEFLSTPMSRGAAILLNSLGMERWKIGSGDILDFVLLDYIRQSGKPVIISSGMSTIQELKKAYDYLAEKVKDITILHCVSQYPCPLDDLNLLTIPFLQKQFPRAKIGFSDHSLEVSTGAMAVKLGATIIEKHFSLDRDAWGPDHKVSLLPHEFSQMVKEIKYSESDLKRREINLRGYIVEDTKDGSKLRKREDGEPLQPMIKIPKEALGVETKFINEKEMQFRPVFRKGLYAADDIPEGKILEPEDFYALRPKGEALKSESYPDLLGTIATKAYKKYEGFK